MSSKYGTYNLKGKTVVLGPLFDERAEAFKFVQDKRRDGEQGWGAYRVSSPVMLKSGDCLVAMDLPETSNDDPLA